MIDKTNIPNETMIDGSKIVIENGEVRTILSEEIQKSGYIPLETAKQLSIARIRKVMARDKMGSNTTQDVEQAIEDLKKME